MKGRKIDPNGHWSKTKGENIVIGIVDSGVWPEHPSFSDRTGINPNDKEGKLSYQQLPGWNGRCMVGTAFTATNCNQKLIGARYYNSGYGGNAGVTASFPYEYNSPRDAGGHGSHTDSTAVCNAGFAITGAGAGFCAISGIAPRARIFVYKVCWGKGDDGGCFSSDSVAAIDQAVADCVLWRPRQVTAVRPMPPWRIPALGLPRWPPLPITAPTPVRLRSACTPAGS